MSSFLILALAGSALAVPFVGEHAHHAHRQHNHFFPSGRVHHHTGTGAPYALANATGIYGATGTAASTGFPIRAGFAPVVSDAAAEATSCSPSTVYETSVQQITVTVKQSSAAEVSPVFLKAESTESSAVSSTASASLTLSLNNKAYEGKQRTWKRKSTVASSTASSVSTSTSDAAAATTSVEAASTTSTSVYVAPTTSSSTSVYVAPSSSVVATSSTSSSAASQFSASSSSGKRGVAYNDASLAAAFEDAPEVTWGYNWGQSSSGLASSFNYVPLLWGTSSTFTSGWDAAVKAASSAGSTHLMSFNEPDLSSQSNLSPEAAAAAYKTYMQPYAGQFKLGAPAVTNGGGAMGLSWLDAFITACDGCTIDFVTIHWYDSASNSDYFKDQVSNATAVAGGKPVWVTEFGCTSGSDADITTFLETVMPWMDSQDFVERYSYFMVSDGLLVSGGETTSYGSTYASYTS